jgi:hypothetical protein
VKTLPPVTLDSTSRQGGPTSPPTRPTAVAPTLGGTPTPTRDAQPEGASVDARILPAPGSGATPTATTTPDPAGKAAISSTPPPDTPVREAVTDGGRARFGYVSGTVDLLGLRPERGYDWAAYRLTPDYVVVRFISRGHVSTIHAYWSDDRRPVVTVSEENY